jgi:hypothetical protein
MQTCPTCQFQSPLGAKFCRQCGAPLLAESEFSGASTRNYGRQAPAFAPAGSAPLPPSIGDVLSSDTARYYQQPPVAPAAPNAFLTPSISTAPLHKKVRSWRYLSFLLVLLVGMALGAILTSINLDEPTPNMDPAFAAHQEAQAAKAELDVALAEQFRAAQEAVRHQEEFMRQKAEEAANSGAPVVPGDAKSLDLTPFEYPGAATGNYNRIPGSEMVQMRSKDSFDAILQHYQKKLGKPLMLMNDGDDDDKSAFFQSTSAPAVYVSIEQDDDHDGFWRITISRGSFQFPRHDMPAPPAAPAPPAPVRP